MDSSASTPTTRTPGDNLPIPPLDIGLTVVAHHSDEHNKQTLESLQQLIHPVRDPDSPESEEYDAYTAAAQQSNLALLFKELELQVRRVCLYICMAAGPLV